MTGRVDEYDFFISYKLQDVHVAREIADQLIGSGIRVWFDEYQILLINKSELGEVPKEVYVDAIRRSTFGLAITNNSYAESFHCALEMDALLQCLGPSRVLEVRWPDEDGPRCRWPELSSSPHCAPHETSEILSFMQAHTGRRIRPMVRIDELAPSQSVSGRFLRERYTLDVTGWDVIKSRGHRSLLGGVTGPVLRYTGERYPIHANVRAGRETAEARPPARESERDHLDFLHEHQLPRHLARLGAEIRGLHILFHHDLIQLAVTYRMHGYWTRKHSVVLPHPSGRALAEFVFTFGFAGPFAEYCRHARLMDRLVTTLEWGDFPGAVEEFTRTIMFRPDVPEGYQERGLAYARSGQVEKAIADFKRVIKICKSRQGGCSPQLMIDAHYNCALGFEKLGRYPEALSHYDHVIELQPKNSKAWCNRGNVLLQQGEFEKAAESQTKAIEADERDYRAYWGRAIANYQLSRRDRVVADLRSYLSTAPSYDEDIEKARRLLAKYESRS